MRNESNAFVFVWTFRVARVCQPIAVVNTTSTASNLRGPTLPWKQMAKQSQTLLCNHAQVSGSGLETRDLRQAKTEDLVAAMMLSTLWTRISAVSVEASSVLGGVIVVYPHLMSIKEPHLRDKPRRVVQTSFVKAPSTTLIQPHRRSS